MAKKKQSETKKSAAPEQLPVPGPGETLFDLEFDDGSKITVAARDELDAFTKFTKMQKKDQTNE